MKKAAKVEYGIEIVKPWSKAMYDHNDMVADAVRVKLFEMWTRATPFGEMDSLKEEFASELDWLDAATPEMIKIQCVVLGYGFGYGFSIAEVSRRVEEELEDAPYFRLKEIAEELELDLKQGFVGL